MRKPWSAACFAASAGLFLLGTLRLAGGLHPAPSLARDAVDLTLQTYAIFLGLSLQAEVYRLYQSKTPQV